MESSLPEGLLKPAPPKSRKSDLIKPNCFTIADKIVDQTPGNAFNSVKKLAGYVSQSAKKNELESSGEDDLETDTRNLPPPLPVTTRKKDIVRSPSIFAKINEHAKNTPESVQFSLEKLAAHLCSVAQSDLEKVRAFYVWICKNISYVYDKGKTLSDKIRFDAVSTLRQRQGSYVNLMVALCRATSIPVVTISGYSKGLRHQPDVQFSGNERNHSWNAVFINGEWRFIDCTWGSGYLDSEGKFKRQFDEFWFLTDPEIFIYDHFPTHEKWQLLEKPIDIDEFNQKLSMTEKSMELGFKSVSHREPTVICIKDLTLAFSTDTYPLSSITADFRNTDGQDVNRNRCIRRINKTTFEIKLSPPKPGEYILIVYGQAKDYRHAKFRKLMEYTVVCESAHKNEVIYPDHLKAWGFEPNYASYGFADTIENMSVFETDGAEMTLSLDQTKNVTLMAELKSARDMKSELEGYTLIAASETGKIVHIRFPSAGFYKLSIYAEGPSEKFEYAASFLLECNVNGQSKMFPKMNVDSISKFACELIEPMTHEVPANSNVTFSLRSRGLKFMVGIPTVQDSGSRMTGLGELQKTGDVFRGQIKTPKSGETIYLSGCGAAPYVFWSRVYEFVTL